MKSKDLIDTAYRLARSGSRRPRRADLNRAISTAYYALFHAMAKDAADHLIGVGRDRPDRAWMQTYRSLEHGEGKAACQRCRGLDFPDDIVRCAEAFVTLQEMRHEADYNPNHRPLRSDALVAISLAEDAIRQLRSVDRKHRRAFAALLLLKRRRN